MLAWRPRRPGCVVLGGGSGGGCGGAEGADWRGGAPGEEPRRRGPAGEGGGDPGPLRLQRPGLPRRAPRAAPRREGAPGGASARTLSLTARPGSEQLLQRTPASGSARWGGSLGLQRERQKEGQDIGED